MVRTLTIPVVAMAILLASATGLAMQFKDPKIASRPLDDADMVKYVAILGELTKARKQIRGISTPAGGQQLQAAKAKACESQGWGTLDYSVVDSRIVVAQQHIKMEKTTPVPADKAADVALARKWADRIAAAKK